MSSEYRDWVYACDRSRWNPLGSTLESIMDDAVRICRPSCRFPSADEGRGPVVSLGNEATAGPALVDGLNEIID